MIEQTDKGGTFMWSKQCIRSAVLAVVFFFSLPWAGPEARADGYPDMTGSTSDYIPAAAAFLPALAAPAGPGTALPLLMPGLAPFLAGRAAGPACPKPPTPKTPQDTGSTERHFAGQVLILLYHHLDPRESSITITPDRFEQHLKALQMHRYHVVSLEDAIAFLEGKTTLPANAVVLTFDDGYDSFYRFAYPLLKRHGMTATNFVIVGTIGTSSPYFTFLSWSQMREMSCDGFGFYSHTYDLHNDLPGENGRMVTPLDHRIVLEGTGALETEEEHRQKVLRDLSLAKDLLRVRLGNRLSVLSFPHGDYSEDTVSLAQSVGIRYFATTTPGLNRPGEHLLRRVHAGMPYISGDGLIQMLSAYMRMK